MTSMRAEMRSLYVRREDCPWAPDHCRVLEVTPLARELIKRFVRCRPTTPKQAAPNNDW